MEKTEEEVIQFLKSIPVTEEGVCKAYGIQHHGDVSYKQQGDICHYSVVTKDGAMFIGATFMETDKNSHMTRLFWEWISSENSPWRKLHPLTPVYRDDGFQNGWYVKRDVIKSVPFLFIKNFMILTRTVTEYANRFYFWEKLVQNGMNPADAMYLCWYFSIDEKGVIAKGTRGVPNGEHWAITDHYVEGHGAQYNFQFDWNAFRTGKINDNINFSEKINRFFLKKLEPGYKPYKPEDVKEKFVKTTFSQLSYYDIDNIMKSFYGWQEEMGVKNG